MPWYCPICRGQHEVAAAVTCPNEIAKLRAEVLDLRRLLGPYSTVEIALQAQDADLVESEKLHAEVGRLKSLDAGRDAVLIGVIGERDAALLQVRDKDEEIASLKESLLHVLEISEVEGAVNLTVEESCKVMGARTLLGSESRFAQKPKSGIEEVCPVCWADGTPCADCGSTGKAPSAIKPKDRPHFERQGLCWCGQDHPGVEKRKCGQPIIEIGENCQNKMPCARHAPCSVCGRPTGGCCTVAV